MRLQPLGSSSTADSAAVSPVKHLAITRYHTATVEAGCRSHVDHQDQGGQRPGRKCTAAAMWSKWYIPTPFYSVLSPGGINFACEAGWAFCLAHSSEKNGTRERPNSLARHTTSSSCFPNGSALCVTVKKTLFKDIFRANRIWTNKC